MDSERYLCYAESPSDDSGYLPDNDSCSSGFLPPFPWENGGKLLQPYYPCVKWDGIIQATNELCQPWAECPKSENPPRTSQEKRQGVGDYTLFALLFAIELALVYAAYRVGRYSGIIGAEGIRKLKGRLMEMADLKTPAAAPPLHPSMTIEQDCAAQPVPDSSADGLESKKSQEKTLPLSISLEDSGNGVGDSSKSAGNPAKVAWSNFINAFRKRDAHEPFPPLEVAPDVSEAETDSLLAKESLGIGKLLTDSQNRDKRRAIAQKFLVRFPKPTSEWNGASILMTADEDTTYWVAGDIHAKVSAIAKICAFIANRHHNEQTKKHNVLILLGDYVDRGNEPLETLAFIEELKLHPLFDDFKIITLKGNHDVGLSRNGEGGYESMVSPSETAEYFQECVNRGDDVSVEADAAMRLAAVSPRMCELTGVDLADKSRTMLFVHGGVPHVDLQEKLYGVRNQIPQGEPFFAALANESIPEGVRKSCAEDFTWISLSKDLPLKQPNRGSRGCEIGTEDVSQYLFLHRALTSRDVTFIFRGHDHERPGFACYSPHPVLNPTKKRFAQRECNVLTLNAMEPDFSSGGMFRERDLALAEWTIGNPVRLHRIVTHHLEVAKKASPPPESSETAPAVQPQSAGEVEPK